MEDIPLKSVRVGDDGVNPDQIIETIIDAIDWGNIEPFCTNLERANDDDKNKIFQELCTKPGHPEFIAACIEAGCDVNKVSQLQFL